MTALKTGTALPRLVCKPTGGDTILYSSDTPNGKLAFRSLQLSTDLDTIYEWVNQSYSARFWQMNGSKHALQATYGSILANPHAHSFMALLDGSPVAQVDVYQVLADELARQVDAADNDCGLHLLMLPTKQSRKNLSLDTLRAFIGFYCSIPGVGNLYAEPDIENAAANLLARKAGLTFLKTLRLSYKTANLYVVHPHSFPSTNL